MMRVLIVDDEPFSLKFLAQVLRNIGIGEIVSAAGGGEALEKLAELADEELDLIVADIQMPDMDGYELTRRVRYGAVPRHKDVAILILSSSMTEENLRHARTHKIDSLVAKPPTVDVLRLEIDAALQHAAARIAANRG